MTQTAAPYDVRISGLIPTLKTQATPQTVYYDKANDVRAERLDGALHLYRLEDIRRINSHPAVLGTGGRGPMLSGGVPLIPLDIDGVEHKKWRRLLDPMFSPKNVLLLEAQVRTLAVDLIAPIAPAGRAELYQEFCVPLPCLTFLRLIGAPIADLDFLLEFSQGIVHPEGDTAEEVNASMAVAGAKILEYFVGFLADKRRNAEHDDDVIANLIRSEVDGQSLAESDLINIVFLLMFAGLDTVTSSLSCMFNYLGQNPEQRRALIDDMSLLPAAIEELLRYESPSPAGMRYPQEDIDLGDGLVAKAGEAIATVLAAGNVDPTHFSDPLTVDWGRGRTDHLAFASGTHRCLGSHLARLELRLSLEEFLTRIPEYTVLADEVAYNNTAVRSVQNLQITFAPATR
jgi:cytochrome P450